MGLVSLGAIGGLVVWHLVRRGRLIREGLSPPRKVGLTEFAAETKTKSDPNSNPNTKTMIEPKPTGAGGTDADVEDEEQGPRPS